jgi:hypothetical protein
MSALTALDANDAGEPANGAEASHRLEATPPPLPKRAAQQKHRGISTFGHLHPDRRARFYNRRIPDQIEQAGHIILKAVGLPFKNEDK